MTFSGCRSYHKDTFDYDEYIAIQYVLNEFEGGMTAVKCQRIIMIFLSFKKAIFIIQLNKTICISLKIVRGVQLSIV